MQMQYCGQYHNGHLFSPSLFTFPNPKPLPAVRLFSTSTTRPRTQLCVSAATTSTATTMYDLLAVPETARQEEIKAAYRKQARRWHPDTCRSAEDKRFFSQQFMRATEAYRVLSDPVLRQDYDYSLRTGLSSSSRGGGGGVMFREGQAASRRGNEWRRGFGDWEAQVDGLRRRRAMSSSTSSSSPLSWGSRMRMRSASRPSD